MRASIYLALLLASPLALAADNTGDPTLSAEPSPFEKRFQQLDTNHDEALSREEVSAQQEQLLTTNFDKIDTNHDKKLDRQEVEKFITNLQRTLQTKREAFIAAMKASDKNGDGAWTKKELKSAKGKLASLEKNFDAIDANGDKQITEEEITAFARSGKAN